MRVRLKEELVTKLRKKVITQKKKNKKSRRENASVQLQKQTMAYCYKGCLSPERSA